MDFRSAFLRALVCACVPISAIAFESGEHEKLGNLSLLVALEYFKTHPEEFKGRAAAYDLAQDLKGDAGKYNRYSKEDHNRVTYGDIVACVDYYLYPEKLLNVLQETDKQPLMELKDCRGIFGSRFMQATHTNQAHFRNGALRSYRVRHTAAIKAADDPKQIRYALMLNALADHYLHDLFAPGHIFTRRDDLSDTFATAVHDRYNANGDVPRIKFKTKFGNLKDLKSSLCEPSPSQPECTLRAELKPLAPHATPERIDAAFQELERDAAIELKGDDFLWENDGEQLKQRLLIVLIGARSILDVLGKPRDSFADMQWQEHDNLPTMARLAYGEYDLADAANQPPVLQRPDFTTYPVIGLSYSRESMFSEGRAGRNVYAIETPLGFDIFGRLRRGGESWVIAPIVGWTYYHESSVHGSGPTLRFALVKPQTEFVYGPYFRLLSYPKGDERVRRFSWGGRVDTGFSSYFTFFLALGRDYGTTPDGAFSQGWVGTAGVEVLLPLNRIKRTVSSLRKGNE